MASVLKHGPVHTDNIRLPSNKNFHRWNSGIKSQIQVPINPSQKDTAISVTEFAALAQEELQQEL